MISVDGAKKFRVVKGRLPKSKLLPKSFSLGERGIPVRLSHLIMSVLRYYSSVSFFKITMRIVP